MSILRAALVLVMSVIGALTLGGSVAHAHFIEPEKDGVSPAPIHGDAVAVQFSWKRSWPKGRELPEVTGKALFIHWSGRARTPNGHALPVLYLVVDLTVPAGAQLTTTSDRPLTPQRLDADNRDSYRVQLPVTRVEKNAVPFFVKFPDGSFSEFDLEFTLKLQETVFGAHPSCEALSVKLVEKTAGKMPGFLLARCERSDRVLYLNVMKPQDLDFATGAQVIRVPMPEGQLPKQGPLAEVRLTSPKKKSEIYVFEYAGAPPSHWRVALGLAPTLVSHRDLDTSGSAITQLPLIARLWLGYRFVPEKVELDFDGYATVLPIMLNSPNVPVAYWHGAALHAGYLFPFEDYEEHVLGVYVGWRDWMMSVSDKAYGLPRSGFNDLGGPEAKVTYRSQPLGRLGWAAIGRIAALSFSTETLARGVIAAGVQHDLPWLKILPRRPAVTLDAEFVRFTLRAVSMGETRVSVGLLYPLF